MIAGKFHIEPMSPGVSWQTFSLGTDARYMTTGIDYAYKCDANDTLGNKGGIRITRTNGGNPLCWADNTDKFIKTFSYDNQGRLANADIAGVSRTDYGYDWVGNRTNPTAVYNDADQLTSYSGNTYNYNNEGGMYAGAGRTFGYYSNGDPYQVSFNGNNKNGKFDTHGLREVTYGASTIKYCYDITASIPALISEGPSDGTTTYYYVREPSGELVMRKNGTDLKYYHFDDLGSTLFLTDANGIQTDKYVYNAWGKVVSSSGTTANPFRYVGRLGYYYDTETNLYLLGKRYYDADAGVFCQRDKAKDGLSYYAYTSGNVMTAVDPWGEDSCNRAGDIAADVYKTYTGPVENMNYGYKYLLLLQGIVGDTSKFNDCKNARYGKAGSACSNMCIRESKKPNWDQPVIVRGNGTAYITIRSMLYAERCFCESVVVCMKRNINLSNQKNRNIYNKVRKACQDVGGLLWGDRYHPSVEIH